MNAVIMAGGLGTRLRPLTYAIPKPLLPIGDRPILEILLIQLARAGFARAFVSTGYKGELIKSYFGDGGRFGLAVEYVDEGEPLGTAGALCLIRDQLTAAPFLMVNGDILTRFDFGGFLKGHSESGADFTAAAVRHEVTIPYGVIQGNGAAIEAVVEKPTESRLVLGGIYAVSPSALAHLPAGGGRVDVPDLIGRIIEHGGRVLHQTIDAFWIDVAKMDDFERAREELATWDDL
jgi:NDP-sugar pyrophosphorylase family protein